MSQLRLRISDADGEREVRLERRVSTIGAAPDCHLQLHGERIAPVHAIIYREPTGHRLTTAGGEVLDPAGRPLAGSQMTAGDRLSIGTAWIAVLEEAPPAETPAPPADKATDGTAVTRAMLEQLDVFGRSVLANEPWPRPAEQLLDALLRLTGADHGFLLLVEGGARRIIAARPQLSEPEQQRLLSDSIVERVLSAREMLALDDAGGDPVYATAPSVTQLKLTSVLCLPLLVGSELRGALYVGHRSRPAVFGQTARAAMRAFGAQAALLLEAGRHVATLRHTVEDLRQRLDHAARRELVGQSEPMQRLLELLGRAAPTDTTVLLIGETGTGKELLARWIHRRSSRRDGPFVPVNCAAIPDDLLESELFGHRRGAFTGALRDQPGLVEAAAGGSLFLDEIGELPERPQAKLLRSLQERSVRRLGEQSDRPVDLRVIAASNRELLDSPAFRQDLYYRLAQVAVQVPPLRQRREDLELMLPYFLGRFSTEFQRGRLRLSDQGRAAALGHDWPGNVRELENRLRRAVLLAEGDLIEAEDLGLADRSELDPLAVARDRFVAEHVRRALVLTGGDRHEAARRLGIGLRSLYRYLQADKHDQDDEDNRD